MARRCPGCGKVHSRKTCPHCLYTPFQEEEYLPSSHRKWGEVTSDPPPRDPRRVSTIPQWQKQSAPRPRTVRPAGTGYETRRRSRSAKPAKAVVIALLVLMLLPWILGVAFAVVEEVVSDITYAVPEPAPEHLQLPEDGVVLCDEQGFTLVADWPGGPIDGDVRIVARNDSGKDLTACTNGVAINGCMYDDAFFYCEAPEGGMAETWFWIDMEDLFKTTGIKTIETITFRTEVYDSREYREYLPAMTTTLCPSGSADFRQPLNRDGQLLFDRDGVCLVYQDAWETDNNTWIFRFYAENNTDKLLNLYSDEVYIDGEETGHFFGQLLLPQTAAVMDLELYDPEQFDGDLAARQNLTFFMEASFEEGDSYAGGFTTEILEVNLKK